MDFANVEHALLQIVLIAHASPTLIILAGDDLWRIVGEFGNALKDIFACVRREVGDQLVVDGEVGREHKEVANVVDPM